MISIVNILNSLNSSNDVQVSMSATIIKAN